MHIHKKKWKINIKYIIYYHLTNKNDYKTFNDSLNTIRNIDKNNVLSYDVKGFNTVDETTTKDMKTNTSMTMLIIKKVPNINLI